MTTKNLLVELFVEELPPRTPAVLITEGAPAPLRNDGSAIVRIGVV
jgi:hypothetical protein